MPWGFGWGRKRRGWGWRFRRYWFNFTSTYQPKEGESTPYKSTEPFLYQPSWTKPGWVGWRRLQYALQVGDIDRALFGLGPCGELAYQEYKKRLEKKS